MLKKYFILALFVQIVESTYNQPRTPVLLVPGVGGSKQYDSSGKKIWVVFNENNYATGCLASPNCGVRTYWSKYGLSEVDVLDPELIVGSDQSNYFKPLIEHLQNTGYTPGIDLFAMPYVWRDALNDQDIMDDLHWFVQNLNPIIITHSMGGLIVEKYLQHYPQADIKKVINLSVPFHGAGGYALKAFIHGYNLGNPLVASYTQQLLDIAKRFSSTYWLLAKKGLDESGEIKLKIDNSDYLDYLRILTDFNQTNLEISDKLYNNLKKSEVKNFYIMYKTNGNPNTPWSYDTTNKIFTSYVMGDGTVPLVSQRPSYADPDTSEIIIGASDHVGMLGDSDVQRTITTQLFPCDLAGKYVSQNTQYRLIYTLERGKYALTDLNGTQIDKEWRWYFNCYAINIDGQKYDRVIGANCAAYIVYAETYMKEYYYQKKCHYGDIVSLVHRVCYKNETYYNPVLDRCYDKITGDAERNGYLDVRNYQKRKDFIEALGVSLDSPGRIVYLTEYNNKTLPGDTVYINIELYNEKVREMQEYYIHESTGKWIISGIVGWALVLIAIVVIVFLSVKLYRLKWMKEIRYSQVIESEL